MTDPKEEIKTALEDTPELRSLSDSWPTAKTRLPAIVVDLASEKGADRRDDKRYLTEIEFYVRIFAHSPAEIHALFEGVKPRMEALGYELTFRFDQNTTGTKQLVTIWTKTIPT